MSAKFILNCNGPPSFINTLSVSLGCKSVASNESVVVSTCATLSSVDINRSRMLLVPPSGRDRDGGQRRKRDGDEAVASGEIRPECGVMNSRPATWHAQIITSQTSHCLRVCVGACLCVFVCNDSHLQKVLCAPDCLLSWWGEYHHLLSFDHKQLEEAGNREDTSDSIESFVTRFWMRKLTGF